MKTLDYGWKYLRLLRQSYHGRDLFATLKTTARQCGLDSGDIAEATYWLSAYWHGGQRDPLYSSMCVNPFRPSPLANGPGESALELYNALWRTLKRFNP